MNRKVVVINGSGGVGKDTFVELVNISLQDLKAGKCSVCSMVDDVKRIAREMGWTGAKTDKDRKFLADIKRLWDDYNEGAFTGLVKNIENFIKGSSEFNVLFVMVREPRDIDRLASLFDIKTMIVKSDRVKKIESNEADKNVDNYKYDLTIYNNGSLQDLKIIAMEVAKELCKDSLKH